MIIKRVCLLFLNKNVEVLIHYDKDPVSSVLVDMNKQLVIIANGDAVAERF